MKRTRKLLVMLVLTTALVLAIIIFMQNRINDAAHFVQPTGPLKMSAQANINTFMEAQTSEGAAGKDNYHCANILYGYDDKYADDLFGR